MSSINLFNSNNSNNQKCHLPFGNYSFLNSKTEFADPTPMVNCSCCSNLFDQFHHDQDPNHPDRSLSVSHSNLTQYSLGPPFLPISSTHCSYSRSYPNPSYLGLIKSDKLLTTENRNLMEDTFPTTQLGQIHTRIGNTVVEEPKPNFSYIGLIAKAILSTLDRRMILSEIYQWIQMNYPYFRTRGPGWRNSIRHNLSLNDCFIKVGRAANGKGHYWGIHPANLKDFLHGDFRRRRAQRKVRQALGLSCPTDDRDTPSPCSTPEQSSPLFVPQLNSMTHLKTQALQMTRFYTPNYLQSENLKEEPNNQNSDSYPHESLHVRNRSVYPFSCSIKPITYKLPLTDMNPAHTPTTNQTSQLNPFKESDPMLRLIYTNLLNMLNQFPTLNQKLLKIPSLHKLNSSDNKLSCSTSVRPGDKCSFSVANLLDDSKSKQTNPSLGQISLVDRPESETGSYSVDALDSTEHVFVDLLDSSGTTNSNSSSILKSNDEEKRREYANPIDYTFVRNDLQKK